MHDQRRNLGYVRIGLMSIMLLGRQNCIIKCKKNRDKVLEDRNMLRKIFLH